MTSKKVFNTCYLFHFLYISFYIIQYYSIGILICRIEKLIPETEFKDLDKLSNLLDEKLNTTNKETKIKKRIEVISNSEEVVKKENPFTNLNMSYKEKVELLNKLVNEEIAEQKKSLSLNNFYNYGFNNEFSKVFNKREVHLYFFNKLIHF